MLMGRDDFFDFTQSEDYDLTTMSRGTIIKFDGYIKVPEEFDYTQTIDRFKPLLVASIVNDSMDKPEQAAVKSFFETTDTKIPVLIDLRERLMCSKLISNNMLVKYTDLINIYVRDDKEKLKVFDKNGVYLPMKKIGKNNPKAEQIEANNRVRTMWNQTVDRALVSGVPEEQILEVKQSEIGQTAKASIQKSGRNPALFKSLIMTAIYALELLISKVFKTALEKADKVTEGGVKSEPEQMKVWAVNELVMAKSEPIPEMPKKSKPASNYPRLADIYSKLEKQNKAICQREQQLASVEKEIAGTKGIFKGKQRKELQEQAEQLMIQIANMKQYLSSIVQSYGYNNVKEFLAEYHTCKTEYCDYQSAVARWEQQAGNKAESDSLKARLQRKAQEVKERENNRQSQHYRSDRGGR